MKQEKLEEQAHRKNKGEDDGLAVRNLPANAEDAGLIPDQEDALEKEMVTHSNTPAWEIHGQKKPERLQSMGSQNSQTRLKTKQQVKWTASGNLWYSMGSQLSTL